MRQLIECVPNFSEGRRVEVVQQIVAAIASVDGVVVLDLGMDAHHNRAVVTFVGDAAAVEEAAFRAVAKAAERIDLDTHLGEHPRMGATDVVPFIPISGATPDDCVAIARRLGERVGRELNIPVYLYEDAATREANRNLADVRRGGYELLKLEIETNPERAPDFGPRQLGKAGAVAIGARAPLIAFNANLGTSDIKIAKAIARAVRHSSGGLPFVKALGFELKERGMVQVSMNLTNYQETPLFRVFEMIKLEAARYGVPIIESEIIGLAPEKALLDTAAYYLQLAHFSPRQILEIRLVEALTPRPPLLSGIRVSVTGEGETFLDHLAAPTAAPGGGSAAAQTGAMAAALLMMYTGLTLTRKNYAAAHEEMQRVHELVQQLKDELSAAVGEDAQAYAAVMHAYQLPKDSEMRPAAIQQAMQHATEVQMHVAERSAQVLQLIQQVIDSGLMTARSDAKVATYLAQAALKSALLNVHENLERLSDEKLRAEYEQKIRKLGETA